MTLQSRMSLSCVSLALLLLACGCGKDGEEKQASPSAPAAGGTQTAAVDTQKPIAEVQTQAQAMNVESLKATVQSYKDAILAKQAEIEKLVAKIKETPIAEALGEQAKTLKGDLTNLETGLKALKDRFEVYYDALKQKGGDVAGLAL